MALSPRWLEYYYGFAMGGLWQKDLDMSCLISPKNAQPLSGPRRNFRHPPPSPFSHKRHNVLNVISTRCVWVQMVAMIWPGPLPHGDMYDECIPKTRAVWVPAFLSDEQSAAKLGAISSAHAAEAELSVTRLCDSMFPQLLKTSTCLFMLTPRQTHQLINSMLSNT